MIEVLLGLLGAAIGAAFFIAGFQLGKKNAVVVERRDFTADERDAAAVEEERERLREEQRAFHDLLGYNADVAYGRKKMDGKG